MLKEKSCIKGFTLIELLVVVLIIGILASIAVPQYQKAVDKSKYTQAMVLMDTIYKAQDVYFLANGQYTFHWDELGADVPPPGARPYNPLPSSDRAFPRPGPAGSHLPRRIPSPRRHRPP